MTSTLNRRLELTRTRLDSAMISAALSTLVVLAFVLGSDRFLHWFIIPVWACGVLVGIDAVDWFRARLPLFDPVGVIGVLGLHFFFLAPLLHVYWNYFMETPTALLDWRPSLGAMAAFNFLGLLAYRWTRNWFLKSAPPPQRIVCRLDEARLMLAAPFFLIGTALLQIWVYKSFGGIPAYISAAISPVIPDRMAGYGIVFLISESFPILAMMVFVVKARHKASWQSWGVLALVMLVFLATRILFGGLRGSRSTILFALLWAGGLIHFWIRPIPRQAIFMGVAFLVLFMYGYGFFKGAGTAAFQNIGSAQGRAALSQETGRDYQTTILGDLARTDIQAFILYRLWSPESLYHNDYQYAWGRTYLGALALVVPHSLWPNRPNHKVQEGTEIIYGRGTYLEGEVWSSKIYGLAGETMLNFGPLAIPFAFALFGVAIGAARRFLLDLTTGDTRLLLYPFLVTLCVLMLTADSDNILFYIVQHGTMATLLTLCGTRIMRQTRASAPVASSQRSANAAVAA